MGNQALDWPSILKVSFKNQARFRIPLPLKCALLSSNADLKIIRKLTSGLLLFFTLSNFLDVI